MKFAVVADDKFIYVAFEITDDDGVDRDHKLIWSAEEVKLGEDSW